MATDPQNGRSKVADIQAFLAKFGAKTWSKVPRAEKSASDELLGRLAVILRVDEKGVATVVTADDEVEHSLAIGKKLAHTVKRIVGESGDGLASTSPVACIFAMRNKERILLPPDTDYAEWQTAEKERLAKAAAEAEKAEVQAKRAAAAEKRKATREANKAAKAAAAATSPTAPTTGEAN